MKRTKLLYIIVVNALVCILSTACRKEYPQFDSGFASVRFVYNQAREDSTVYSFALHPNIGEGVVEIPLRIIGLPQSVSREVGIEIDREKSTAATENFFIEKCEIAQDMLMGTLRVIVRKTKDLDNKPSIISLRLCENNFFSAAPINESHFRIILTNSLVRPADWPKEFGIYSSVKPKFVIQLTQKGTDYKEWNAQELIYYIGLLNKALYEYNKNHPGEPLTDENGLAVTF